MFWPSVQTNLVDSYFREEADLFFADFPEATAHKGIFKHMFIGRLNKTLSQKFIKLHLAHHLKLCGL